MYKYFIKPFLFLFSPESAHRIVALIISIPLVKPIIKILFNYQHSALSRNIAGIQFKNPVGLAAGFDKDAELIDEMAAIGFGFIEIGTLTPLGQDGNPKPRSFRLPKDHALINRMGFNNKGVDIAIEQLKKKRPKGLIIGGNIGKNKITPLDKAIDDYTYCFKKLFPYVDYFVVNVSSPNTPNLRQLQDKEPLSNILNALVNLNKENSNPKPIFLKIAPDLSNGQLDDIINIVIETKIAGIVATNTTTTRDNLITNKSIIQNIGDGGLSGLPLRKKSTEIIEYIYQKSNGTFPIIAAGGIHSSEDAIEKLNAGASLIQVFTGFIYEGPMIVKNINKSLVTKIK